MQTARLKLRIIEKVSRRTYEAYWPWPDGIAICIATGTMQLVQPGTSGYKEFNDRGSPVLDSWTVEPLLVAHIGCN